ncbi:MAG: hypothetical protein IT162_06290 [Bryobacterales bacterium]|nr:hypothetical protein [Bryobacterales bacterium]
MNPYVLAVLVPLLGGAVAAQSTGNVTLPAGDSTRELRIAIAAPVAEHDRLMISASASKLAYTLAVPGGAALAGEEHFSMRSAYSPQLGEPDGGESVTLFFTQPYPAGEYVLRITGRGLPKPAAVEAKVVSRASEAQEARRMLGGGQEPVTLQLNAQKPAGDIELKVDQALPGGFFDILVSDPRVKLQLTMPDGRTMTPDAVAAGLAWQQQSAGEIQKSGGGAGFFDFRGLFLDGPGTHHVIAFEQTAGPAGRYRIHADANGAGAATVTAAWVNLIGQMQAAETAEAESKAGFGPVEVVAYGDEFKAVYAGDTVSPTFGVRGAVDPASLVFRARVEHRAATGPERLGPVTVQPGNLVFRRNAQGLYQAKVLAARPGEWRVGVRVSGKQKDGKPFAIDERIAGPWHVSPLMARFRGLTEKAIDTNKDGTFERLDVAAQLQVVSPGRFHMDFDMESATGRLRSSGSQTLAVGERALTVTVPALDLRQNLGDGPWTIKNLRISRSPNDETFGEYIATPEGTGLTTAPYRRAQWSRGSAWVDEVAQVAGAVPLPSGKFGMAEVSWRVSVPRDGCDLYAELKRADGRDGPFLFNGHRPPKGVSTLKFILNPAWFFDGGESDLTFGGSLSCGDGEARLYVHERVRFTVNRELFEPPASKLLLHVYGEMREAAPGFVTARIDAIGRPFGSVKMELGDLPPGIKVEEWRNEPQSREPGATGLWDLRCSIDASVKPGRYPLRITATAGPETAVTYVVIEVTAQ